ncbi:DUF2141 domain-containing protein [Flaviflagellibacter deserti]|jgi:uncharacterized protein (DUF2141 family)|uniref:DUF2141 domain-containing protein n=1 Tax=Flaviflagellibacter deserti TaxID=2267266 RepID=A0ABV9Z030_9HYPH
MKLLMLALAGVLSAAGTANAATVTLIIDGIDVGKGVVNVAFCDKGPLDQCRQFKSNQPATADTVGFRFENVPAGSYAFVGYQDVNSNDTFDKNFVGMPKEPFALSNNAGDKLFPPPGYQDLALPIAEGQDNVINITLQTMGGKKKQQPTSAKTSIESIPMITVPNPSVASTPALSTARSSTAAAPPARK